MSNMPSQGDKQTAATKIAEIATAALDCSTPEDIHGILNNMLTVATLIAKWIRML